MTASHPPCPSPAAAGEPEAQSGVGAPAQRIERGELLERHRDCLLPVSYTHLTLPTIYSV